MAREDPQMKLRLPVDLKSRIEEVAKSSNRTLNAEIVDRLQGTFKQPNTEIQFSRGDDASEEMFANIRRLREEGRSKDAEIAALQNELKLRTDSSAMERKLISSQGTLIVALENYVVELFHLIPEDQKTDDLRRIASSCAADAAHGVGDADQPTRPTVNKVILVGNIGRDPEVRYLPSGAPAAVQNAPAQKKATTRAPKVTGPGGSIKKR